MCGVQFSTNFPSPIFTHSAVVEHMHDFLSEAYIHGNSRITKKSECLWIPTEVLARVTNMVETQALRDVYSKVTLEKSPSAPRHAKNVKNNKFSNLKEKGPDQFRRKQRRRHASHPEH